MERYFNPQGKELKGRSAFQKTHTYSKKTQNKCDGKTDDDICIKCGRYLKKDGLHNPSRIGGLGYTYLYSDGSKIITDGNP